ncbi:hypothetical protein [Hansschlegelia zhihuaiae]|uniref:Uncharacterized protein n=1 Tax=Hansschlegelia zhihuaiae TaxID=405005 RepID=A0A4Q0M8I3_9HYPH|nr:hypothetical protein [Hansschlegelia zhihuaiae]RXF69223.1 hypothetical protein EK403_18730 [Hansschlegelia zhihuaiae]
MATRTTETTVTFERSFDLTAIEERLPPGTYRLVIDEDEILGISFLAYRRTATMLQTPALPVRGGRIQSHLVDHADLEAAIEADRKQEPAS